MRWLPLSMARGLGLGLGWVAYGVLHQQRALCLTHLRHALGPSVSAKTCRWVVRGVFLNLGKTAMEWFVVDRFSPARLRRLIDVHGVFHLQRALAKGRGVIAVSAHVGNWELLAMALASLGYEGGVLARPLRYAEYEAFFWTMRQRKQVQTFDRGAVKEVAALLRKNQIIGMMPDQDMDSLEGVFVDFFGHPTFTPVGPAALSMITGAPIVPCFIVRDGRRFRVVIEEPIPATKSGDRARDLLEMTQAWSRVVESYIRRYPAQWVWMHRRWKTQPAAVPPGSAAESGLRRATPATLTPALSGIVALISSLMLGGEAVDAKRKAVPPPPPAAIERQMDSFTIAGYAPDGFKRWELEGRGAMAEGKFITILKPDAIGYDLEELPGSTSASSTQPRRAYVKATLGQVDQSSRRIRLEHDVTIHTSDGLWLSSPMVYWLPDRSELTSDHPVRIETDRMLLRGRGAVGQSQLKTARLFTDVEMVLNPGQSQMPNLPTRAPAANRHLTITCDGPLTFDYQRGIAVFERNVKIVDGRGTLDSDRLVVYLDPATHVMKYAEAFGDVRIKQEGGRTATAQRAVYEPQETRVTLLGAPTMMIGPASSAP